MLAARGVAALLEVATTETRLTERLLGQLNGERTLTDLRHIGQALHAAMTIEPARDQLRWSSGFGIRSPRPGSRHAPTAPADWRPTPRPYRS